jgi:hypothetical protein
MPTRPPKPWVPRTDGVGRRARPQLEVQKVDINGLEEKVKTLRRQQSTYQDHLSCVSRCEAPASVHRSACARPTTVRVQPAPYSRGAPSCMHALLAASALRRQRGVCESRRANQTPLNHTGVCAHELWKVLLRIQTIVMQMRLTTTPRSDPSSRRSPEGLGRSSHTEAERHMGAVGWGVTQAVASAER